MNADEARRYVHMFTWSDDELRPACLRVVAAAEQGVAPDDADMAALREVRDIGSDGNDRAAASITLDFADGVVRCQYCGRDKREIVRFTGCVGEHADIAAKMAACRDRIDPPTRANASDVLHAMHALSLGWAEALDGRALKELRDTASVIRHYGAVTPSDAAVASFVDAANAVAKWHANGRPLPPSIRAEVQP